MRIAEKSTLKSLQGLILMLTMLLVSTVSAYSQSNVLKFMGIPVNGTVSQMTQKLRAKGFKPTGKAGVLSGTFKGKKVQLLVLSKNNKVIGIATSTKESMDEGQAFMYYTNVCKQYLDSSDYDYLMSNSSGDQTLSIFTQRSKNSDYNLDPYDSLNRTVVVMLQKTKGSVSILYGKLKDVNSLK